MEVSRCRQLLAAAALAATVVPLLALLSFEVSRPDGTDWFGRSRALLGPSLRNTPASRDPADRNPDSAIPSFGTRIATNPDFHRPPEGVEGLGGEGIHRAERRSGVWFPLHAAGRDGAEADPALAPAADLPLYITSGSPPRFRAGEPVTYRFEAIGGVPPYRWRMELGVGGFALDPFNGFLSGLSETPLVAVLAVYVNDEAGSMDSATYHLTVEEGQPLSILTESLPAGEAGQPYSARLEAAGGIDPYSWIAPEGVPEGFSLDGATGTLGGSSTSGLDQEILFQVSDLGGASDRRRLRLRIGTAVEIITERPLRPASPGLPYALEFAAEGGLPPYEWALAEGSLPTDPGGQPWTLSPSGALTGIAPPIESTYRFLVAVRDAEGAEDRMEFAMAVRRTLIVVPSREKAGVAWSSGDIIRELGGPLSGYTVTRSPGPSPGGPATVVYQGTGTNFVDRGLATGADYHYTLFVHPAGGSPVEFAGAAVRVLPFTKGKGIPGVLADPHADSVRLLRPLSPAGHGAARIPHNVLGPPDGRGTYSPASSPEQVLSLHARPGIPGQHPDSVGGSVVLAFEDNIVESAPGEDFTVFENVFFVGGDPNQRFMEPAVVSVALFEGEWHRFPIDVVPPATPGAIPPTMDPFYYNRGFAGRNATTGGDPTNPLQSGGDSFDLADLGAPHLTWIRFVKIHSTGHGVLRDDAGGHVVEHTDLFNSLSGTGSSGFDLDAVTAANY